MKLSRISATNYRSLRDVSVDLGDLNVFIGTNASGKSTILDALMLLGEGVRERTFKEAVASRGGALHLAWKGVDADRIELRTTFSVDAAEYEWKVGIRKSGGVPGAAFTLQESLHEVSHDRPPVLLLESHDGAGWWWSGEMRRVPLLQSPTDCALAAASADRTFPARTVAEFVANWGFFDPNPFSLRRGWQGIDPDRLDAYGRNLAERLFVIRASRPTVFARILDATRSVLGLPLDLEPRESEGRYYFVQREAGLRHAVHQLGASSGTLRVLALMTAIFEDDEQGLIGIEEPENHVHPAALRDFAEYMQRASERVQLIVTTHSPLLLDAIADPSVVSVVRRDPAAGTIVTAVGDPTGIVEALEESGFGLGEYYQTTGFGG